MLKLTDWKSNVGIDLIDLLRYCVRIQQAELISYATREYI